jgi:mono/diheme cytochrome c family protein
MKRWTTIGLLATCIALRSGRAQAESASMVPIAAPVISTAPSSAAAGRATPDIVAEVRGVFAAKCSGCHGPNLVRPKGRFGYVLDLRRIAENPEMVIPSHPEESELWMLVKAGEMPPPDSPRGPLSEVQKQIVFSWIADGAPDGHQQSAVGEPAAVELESPIDPERTAEPARSVEANTVRAGDASLAVGTRPKSVAMPVSTPSFVSRALLWFGRFHLLAIHFPIALVIAAAIGEFSSAWRRSRVQLQCVSFCVRLAAVAAVPTVVLGWLYAAAGNGAASPQLLTLHRWLGTTNGACIIAAAIGCELDRRRGRRGRLFQFFITLAVLLTVATAHFGAMLVHGTGFFDP